MPEISRDLPALLDRLEEAGGPAGPVPSADGWELVLAENVSAGHPPPLY